MYENTEETYRIRGVRNVWHVPVQEMHIINLDATITKYRTFQFYSRQAESGGEFKQIRALHRSSRTHHNILFQLGK